MFHLNLFFSDEEYEITEEKNNQYRQLFLFVYKILNFFYVIEPLVK